MTRELARYGQQKFAGAHNYISTAGRTWLWQSGDQICADNSVINYLERERQKSFVASSPEALVKTDGQDIFKKNLFASAKRWVKIMNSEYT